jgi:HK97 family phage portal protein
VQKRSLFDLIFGKAEPPSRNYTQLKTLNGYTPIFSTIGDAYDSDVVRTAVDTIARHAAKLKPKHVRYKENGTQTPHSRMERLLAHRPNPYMDAYSFFYKVVTQLYMANNSFIYVDKDPLGTVRALYPLNASTTELLQSEANVYVRFTFMGGQKATLPYEELIHLRRFFNRNDLYGESSSEVLYPTLQLIQTTNDGIVNAIKSSAYLRGILKFTSMLKPDDMKKQRNDFIKDYLDITNNGGVAATDAKADYEPIQNDPKMIDAKQMELIENKVFNFFNVSKAIITSDYKEDQWNAFYSSVLEPLAIQMSLEFTAKLFTPNEINHGNEIIFSANRLTYAANTTKVNMARELLPLGVFTINEIREIFELEPVEGGDKRIQTLNVVDATKANEYQLGEVDADEGNADDGDPSSDGT